MEQRAPERPDFDKGPLNVVGLLDVLLKKLQTMRGDGLYKRWMLAASLAIWSVSEAYGWPPF